ncbi:Tetratricopeptide repeat-containing protein [Lutibacter oricola]|uniref:Tetratricopeptide repeat-containing protein n=1 Tax=Lutibacter oricola TaxID=762486 RepID=A0A1H3DCN0_9FLAO|nr:hypothetical protein [Lutibacter oricola]SDX64080.1 Tetratricopeptide repeat-containing protein [Lutibacter oricola]
MKHNFLHIVFFIGMVSISINSWAQQNVEVPKVNVEEENDLKFQSYFFEALKQKAIKNYDKAIENLEKGYEIYPSSVAVEFEFSKNFLLIKEYAEAELFINKALDKEPKNNFLLAQKVAVLRAQRKTKEAIEVQKKLVELKPKCADQLVLLYIRDQNFVEAEKLISEIEKKALTTRRIKSYKKFIASRKKAFTKNTNVVKPASNDVNIEDLRSQFKKGKSYKALLTLLNKEAELQNYKALLIDVSQGLELFPAQPVLYKLNGVALNKLGKYNEAIDVLTLGIDFVFDNNALEADFYNQLAFSYTKLNNTKEALKYKQKAAALNKG